MESRKGDRLNKKETYSDNLTGRHGYFALPEDCMKAELLLDDFVFSKDDVFSKDAAFLDAHIENCQECKAKYTELLQWKNLLTSAKYEAPENLRKSVMDYINEEHKKNSKHILFKKNMLRFSAAAASVLMITISVFIISIMNKSPMSDNMSTQNDMMTYSGSLTETFAAGDVEMLEPDESHEALDEVYSYYSSDGDTGESYKDDAGMQMLPTEKEEHSEAEAVLPDIPVEAEPQSESVPSALILENPETEDHQPEYEKRVAITSVASSPPPFSECKQFIDAVYMIDYVNIIMGEDSVQKWLDERIVSEPESDKDSADGSESEPEAEQNSGVRPPLLYEAVNYFEIHEETLIALDKTSEGAEYHLGEDAIKALYSHNWEALCKSETSSEGE